MASYNKNGTDKNNYNPRLYHNFSAKADPSSHVPSVQIVSTTPGAWPSTSGELKVFLDYFGENVPEPDQDPGLEWRKTLATFDA